MGKEEFLAGLRSHLSRLPDDEVEKYLGFYSESIDDRMEDGMNECEAVAALGSIDAIADEIIDSQHLGDIVKQKIKKQRSGSSGVSWPWIVLAVLGSPLWLSLLVALCAVVLAVYVCIWALVIGVWAALLALLVSGIATFVYMLARLASQCRSRIDPAGHCMRMHGARGTAVLARKSAGQADRFPYGRLRPLDQASYIR